MDAFPNRDEHAQRPPAMDADEADRRARRRREHEAALAARQRTDLRRAVADIACEFEIAANEVRKCFHLLAQSDRLYDLLRCSREALLSRAIKVS